jgi:hypothetical protein
MSPSAVLSATIDEITTSTLQHATQRVQARRREVGAEAASGAVSEQVLASAGLTALTLSAMRPPSGNFKTDDL